MNESNVGKSSAKQGLSPVDRVKAAVHSLDVFKACNGAVHIARAPGRLDVMGGIADYTGSVVCQMPLSIDAAAAVQKRNDGRVICISQQTPGEVVLQTTDLRDLDARSLRHKIGSDHAWAGYTAGCLAWLMQHYPAASMHNGVTLLIDSDVPAGGGVSSSAAIEVATMTALVSLFNVTLSPMQLAAGCQNVENHVVGAPCGVMDQVVSSQGKKESLLEILCQPAPDGMPAMVQGVRPIPAGYAFIGVHSGVRHEVRGNPYGDTRVAAFMAQKIIRTDLPKHAGLDHLANLSLLDYENDLRPRLPLALTGNAFIEKYQSTGDTATTIDPQKSYHVRAAADHHVREMHRVSRFIKLIKEAAADASTAAHAVSEQAMFEAGTLMNQSHDSYSHCARLGHELTDMLAAMLLDAGPKKGILGCRVTGGGCGGTVAILIRDVTQTHQLINDIRNRYEAQTGRQSMLFTGTSDGSTHTPAIILSLDSNTPDSNTPDLNPKASS